MSDLVAFAYISSVSYDFNSSFASEPELLNPEPKCTMSFIYHLVYLERMKMITPFV